MSGYLAALATRELGVSADPSRVRLETAPPTIKPRRVSAHATPPMAPEPDGAPTRHDDLGPATRLDDDRADDAIDARSSQVEAEYVPRTPRPAALERVLAKRTDESHVGDALERNEVSVNVAPVPPSPLIARSSIPRSIESPSAVVRNQARENRIEPISPLARIARDDATVPPIAVPREQRVTTSLVAPAIPPASGRPLPTVSPRRATADTDSRVPARATPHAELPPVIVTIGRIEVRAISSPAAPSPARSARATMSLDDYLSQRSRGLR